MKDLCIFCRNAQISLRKRAIQHKLGINEGFTKKYKVDRLVYWENYQYVHTAIAREKEIKGWLRIRKIQLIVSMNPTWKDLSLELWPELEAEMRQIRKLLEEEKRKKAGSQARPYEPSRRKQNT